jgi:ubiquinone/menaquinone biosynthesis C-methylase UbiE
MMARVDDLICGFYLHVPIGQRSLEAAIREALDEGHTAVLDAGCGVDAPLTRKFGETFPTVGIDLCHGLPNDLRVVTGDLSSLPFRDGAFSLIFSRSVFEHLTHPEQVLEEFHRVLRPNGVCVILTPNRFDYSSIVAAATPQWFHEWFVKKIYRSAYYDTFPTVYRANTPGFFRAIARSAKPWNIRRLSGVRHYPANLAFSRLLFRIGILYDWVIAKAGLTALQPNLLVVMERPSS